MDLNRDSDCRSRTTHIGCYIGFLHEECPRGSCWIIAARRHDVSGPAGQSPRPHSLFAILPYTSIVSLATTVYRMTYVPWLCI